MKKSYTLKFDGFGIFWNMKGHILVISKTYSFLIVDNLFPRPDDGLGKWDLKFCMGVCLNVLNKRRFRMMITLLLKLISLELRF